MRNARVGLIISLVTLSAWAQAYEVGSVVKWESEPYSQSAHIIRNRIVYSVQVGESILKIARRSDKPEMTTGEQIKCRVGNGQIFVLNEKGKETKYDIVGSESAVAK